MLKSFCEVRLAEKLQVNNAAQTLLAALDFNTDNLQRAALDFIQSNLDLVVKTEAFGALMQKYPRALFNLNKK